MSNYRLIGTVTITMNYNTKEELLLDYEALNMRFNHVKSKMLGKGDDITMGIKVEKAETNG